METAGSDFGSECYRSVQQEEALSGGKHKLGSGKLCVGCNCFCYKCFLIFKYLDFSDKSETGINTRASAEVGFGHLNR